MTGEVGAACFCGRPPVSLVGMRLLDRYLLRELLVPFGYCLSGFLIVWISFDLFADLAEFQRLKLVTFDIFEYYLVKTPELLVFVLPIALLLALLYALTNHARHNELTAIRAAGVSLGRLSLPYLAVGFVLSLLLFAINELWVPQSTETAEEILNRRLPNPLGREASRWEPVRFTNLREKRTWVVEGYNSVTHEMIRPQVIWTLAAGTRIEIRAERAMYQEGAWVFTTVREDTFPAVRGVPPELREMSNLRMPEFTETPDQIKSEIKVGKISNFRQVKKAQLSIKEILDYQRLHPHDPVRGALMATKFHGRLAAPWTCLIVVLIAIPFGAGSGRRNVFVGVASSILICFSYFVLQQLALALGTGGYLPPWLAAWSPNALFAAGGVFLAYRVR